MKTIIVFVACFALAVAVTLPVQLPVQYRSDNIQQPNPQIIQYQNDNNGIGPYNFGFETSDGEKREEHAQVVVENDGPTQVVSGSYSYVGDNGQTYTVNYTADKFGYHPQAAHIPQSIGRF
ncbi:endocuticle structural glycoprotein SgAbd-5-like [Sitodiplosis mosellana]|uniref:endocuticle structural glycoprotein SgAbd-5-like n=1 Tax=Sitodiplosis mosellana TaxID=263140 RepID=UPI0024443F71|nr:endocuticle structural glycoprotein SgAbd-5-like [Sitodiplosis mosellana]